MSIDTFLFDQNVRETGTIDSCCCLYIEPFFLPNVISSTPSVRPYSSSKKDTNGQTVRQRKTKKGELPVLYKVGKSNANVYRLPEHNKHANQENKSYEKNKGIKTKGMMK